MLANIFSALKFAFIAIALLNFDPSPLLGLAETPAFITWAWENKGYACMMAFFLGTFICYKISDKITKIISYFQNEIFGFSENLG
jgi:hypothetical protein